MEAAARSPLVSTSEVASSKSTVKVEGDGRGERAHLRDDLVLGRLARLAGFSASHFSVLFKRAAGLPVHEYVIQRRVERARTLLLRGDLPASQVALETGFAHQSHMARCMRRLLGLTPTAVLREAGNADGVPVG